MPEVTCGTCGLTGELGVTWWGQCVFCKGGPPQEAIPANNHGGDE